MSLRQTRPIESVLASPGTATSLRQCVACKQFGAATVVAKNGARWLPYCEPCLGKIKRAIEWKAKKSR